MVDTRLTCLLLSLLRRKEWQIDPNLRGKHRLCAVKVPARLLTCPPACLLTGQEARLSVWGVCATVICARPWGPSPHPWSPAVPGSEQISREESGPVSVARFSLWCPVCVSPPPHSPGLCRRGRQPQEGQTHAHHTGAVEVSKTSHPCPCSPPSFSSILSDARDSSCNEVTPPQTCPLVSIKSCCTYWG